MKVSRPKDEWIIVENTHEAIISQDLWDQAHEALKERKRSCKNGEVHIFAGLLKCKDCGSAMSYRRRKLADRTSGEFVCHRYGQSGQKGCTTHYITYEQIYSTVLNDIREKASAANENKERFIKRLESENKLLLKTTGKRNEKNLKR